MMTSNEVSTPLSSSLSDNRQYVIIDWYLQPHGSFSSPGRWRDISLRSFSSTQQLIDYFIEYIQKNYPAAAYHADQQYTVVDLCRLAIEESSKLLALNVGEISRVTSRHRWPENHELLLGCLIDAHVIATCYDLSPSHRTSPGNEGETNNVTYCLITQLGNHPAQVKWLCGSRSLREELVERFKRPCRTNSRPTPEEIERFLCRVEKLSIEELCHYVTSRQWHQLDSDAIHGGLVDFIIAGKPLLFNPMVEPLKCSVD